MKKLLITIVTILTTALVVAQEKGTNEISVSVGTITINNLFHSLGDAFLSGSFGTVAYVESQSVSYNFAYKRAIKNNLFLYGELSYEDINEGLRLSKVNIGDVSLKHYTVAVGVDYRYINKEWFSIYSGVAFGFTHKSINYSLDQEKYNELKKSEESSVSLDLFSNSVQQEYDKLKNGTENFTTLQLNALGIRVGKSLAGTLEVGYGYKGVVNLGISYQF